MVHYFILYTFSIRFIFTMCSPLITSPFFLSSIFISFIANKQSVLENFGVLFLKKAELRCYDSTTSQTYVFQSSPWTCKAIDVLRNTLTFCTSYICNLPHHSSRDGAQHPKQEYIEYLSSHLKLTPPDLVSSKM